MCNRRRCECSDLVALRHPCSQPAVDSLLHCRKGLISPKRCEGLGECLLRLLAPQLGAGQQGRHQIDGTVSIPHYELQRRSRTRAWDFISRSLSLEEPGLSERCDLHAHRTISRRSALVKLARELVPRICESMELE